LLISWRWQRRDFQFLFKDAYQLLADFFTEVERVLEEVKK